MWPHLEGKLNIILESAFLTMFAENPKIKEKFFDNFHLEVELKGKAGERRRDFASSSSHPICEDYESTVVPDLGHGISGTDKLLRTILPSQGMSYCDPP